MILDVYLIQKGLCVQKASSGIFIRENGETKEITEQEWNERYPNRTPVCFEPQQEEDNIIYSANITHNLNTMADKAGIYQHLWRPEELQITQAKELIEPLTVGLQKLKSRPDYFKKFNPENGWGNYEGLVRFTENYLNACKEYPDAEINISR